MGDNPSSKVLTPKISRHIDIKNDYQTQRQELDDQNQEILKQTLFLKNGSPDKIIKDVDSSQMSPIQIPQRISSPSPSPELKLRGNSVHTETRFTA